MSKHLKLQMYIKNFDIKLHVSRKKALNIVKINTLSKRKIYKQYLRFIVTEYFLLLNFGISEEKVKNTYIQSEKCQKLRSYITN